MESEMKKKYATLSYDGRGYSVPLSQAGAALNDVLEAAEVDDKWEVKIVEMTDEQFDNLPEFEGF
jgi:hypothetical protein